MKIRKHQIHFFILLFAMCSLLFHPPLDFEAFAATSDGTVDSTVEIDDDTTNGPDLDNIDYFGHSVANIGDLDGDGVNDLAVGANRSEEPNSADNIAGCCVGGKPYVNRGAVHILFMNADGSVKSTAEIIDPTTNGPKLRNNDQFGYSVESISDLNGDGVNDLVVGAFSDNGSAEQQAINYGNIHILFLNTDGSLARSTVEVRDDTTNGPTLSADDAFGSSIANMGDLDGNGYDDLAVGAVFDDNGGSNRGAVHILFMDADGAVESAVEINDSTTNGPTLANGYWFGRSVENIGDLDGDGVNDLAVGANLDSDAGTKRGAVNILFMNADGSVKSTVEIDDDTTNGPVLSNSDNFGMSIANMGDLDGNGVIDLAVGATLDSDAGSKRGAVHILFMHETTQPTVTITSSTGDSGDTVSDTTLSFTATFSESVSNFVVGDITVTGTANGGSPEASNFTGSGTTYTFDVVQGSSDGTVSVSIAAGVATDAAGNENTVSNTYMLTIDTAVTTASGTCTRHVILGNCGTIAINNDEYRIINTWTDVPTTEVLVGQPVTVTLSTPNSPTHTKIHFASVHTEVFSLPPDYQQSAHIDYSPMNNQVTYVSQSQLFQVAGATHRIVQDTDVKNLEMFEVVFTMIFAKPMDTSHVVVETENKFGIPETLYLMDALKVNENLAQALTLEEKSKFELEYESEVDPEPPMEPDVKITCGKGTVLKDNLCVPKEWSFLDFFEHLMKMFG